MLHFLNMEDIPEISQRFHDVYYDSDGWQFGALFRIRDVVPSCLNVVTIHQNYTWIHMALKKGATQDFLHVYE